MRAILDIERPLVDQPQIGFVNQRRALQGMPRPFPLEMMPRDVAEFLVDQRNPRFQRFLIARSPAHEQLGHRLGMLLIHSRLQLHTGWRKDSFTAQSSQCKGPPARLLVTHEVSFAF
jgi:hypothetical protein